MKAHMNRKSPSEIAKIAYSIEAEEWVKTSTSIKELDEFIHLIPSQMLIEKVYTYQLAIDKKAQLHFEFNQRIQRIILYLIIGSFIVAIIALFV